MVVVVVEVLKNQVSHRNLSFVFFHEIVFGSLEVDTVLTLLIISRSQGKL